MDQALRSGGMSSTECPSSYLKRLIQRVNKLMSYRTCSCFVQKQFRGKNIPESVTKTLPHRFVGELEGKLLFEK